MTPRFGAIMREGLPRLLAKQSYIEHCRKYKDGTNVWVTCQKAKSTRTIQQNRYLFGVVYKMIADFTGYDTDDIHEYCKDRFGGKKVIVDKPVSISTTKYTTEEMAEYLDKIKQWSAEFLNLYIPDPNEVEY